MNKYRHEYKYMIDDVQRKILLIKAAGLLKKDPNVGEGDSYWIRSLYFDDLNNTCYFENENGTDPRAKYRIRYYNEDTSHIKLEKKIKEHGMTLKYTCSISKKQCEKFLEGKIPECENRTQAVFFEEIKKKALLPKVIVTYERIPYIYSVGNVRITFDMNITSSNEISKFLENSYMKRPILPLGKSVLEVKWDEIFPIHIKECMALDSLQWNTFSKYYLCRQYNINGGLK